MENIALSFRHSSRATGDPLRYAWRVPRAWNWKRYLQKALGCSARPSLVHGISDSFTKCKKCLSCLSSRCSGSDGGGPSFGKYRSNPIYDLEVGSAMPIRCFTLTRGSKCILTSILKNSATTYKALTRDCSKRHCLFISRWQNAWTTNRHVGSLF